MTINGTFEKSISWLINIIKGSPRPESMTALIAALSHLPGTEATLTLDGFLGWLASASPNDRNKSLFHTKIASWDATRDGDWIGETDPNTPGRRERMIRLFDLNESDAMRFNQMFPQSPTIDPPISITSNYGWERWYTDDRRTPSFYWESYSRHLTTKCKWEPKNIAALDLASSDVIERICDPRATKLRPSKGLVVGFVQSGKTANFTGVIAKAVDAGYRLVIVLAGLQNTLRDQTQRRLDKELLGKQFVGDEYAGAKDWDEFVEHDGLPSRSGAFDWTRLTTADEDLGTSALRLAVEALRFEAADPTLPLRSDRNLRAQRARIAVIKKNKNSLDSLVAALNRAVRDGVRFDEIPALIIDDESDQASINTARSARQRKTINKLIVQVLSILKNAQYVGYTATPFANVLIDPDDTMDLFPSDFIVCLPKPIGYMGVREFIDAELPPTDERSNYWAHIRKVVGKDSDPENLALAIDAYVLAGAIKIFREKQLPFSFKHHTMLVHSSTRTSVHAAEAKVVREMFLSANYLGPQGIARLRNLWESDYRDRCMQRGGSLPTPGSWEVLETCVAEAHSRIMETGDPVIVLNGDDQDAAPDFDSVPVWKIVVGGAKLSRGYTVGGLTVSYYRRTAGATDTLMQMGRWFGFRQNYQDLVRLYIGVDENFGGRGGKLNLYDAFVAASRDEEEFRDQLVRYASLDLDPAERITPKRVPPLVPSHQLPPTAKNKMFNAFPTFINYGAREIQRTSAAMERDGRLANVALFGELLETGEVDACRLCIQTEIGRDSFAAIVAVRSTKTVSEFLERYQWERGRVPGDWPLITEFVRGKHGDPQVESWLIVAPQMEDARNGSISIGGHEFRIKQRSRSENRFLAYTEPEHVRFAKWIVDLQNASAQDAPTMNLKVLRRAVMLVYPVVTPKDWPDEIPALGFALYLPQNNIRRKVAFSVRDPRRPDDIVVAG